jgi:hypothetical protein
LRLICVSLVRSDKGTLTVYEELVLCEESPMPWHHAKDIPRSKQAPHI